MAASGNLRTRIKICCIASTEEGAAAVAAGADAIGLVARMPSGPGPIPDERIAEIARSLPPPIAGFLLTSEDSAEAIADHVRRTGASTVQIVSNLDFRDSAELARLLPSVRRVQVIHVEDRRILHLIDVYANHVHAFLLESMATRGRQRAAIDVVQMQDGELTTMDNTRVPAARVQSIGRLRFSEKWPDTSG